MGRTKEDLERPVLLHCCRDGTITYRKRGEPVFNGKALPFFSVDTTDDAEALQLACCKAQWEEHPQLPGKTWYRDITFSGRLDDLDRMTDRYRDTLAEIQRRRAKGAEAFDHKMVTRQAPRWAWAIIDETLSIDARSSAFDAQLRRDITLACDEVEDCEGGEPSAEPALIPEAKAPTILDHLKGAYDDLCLACHLRLDETGVDSTAHIDKAMRAVNEAIKAEGQDNG